MWRITINEYTHKLTPIDDHTRAQVVLLRVERDYSLPSHHLITERCAPPRSLAMPTAKLPPQHSLVHHVLNFNMAIAKQKEKTKAKTGRNPDGESTKDADKERVIKALFKSNRSLFHLDPTNEEIDLLNDFFARQAKDVEANVSCLRGWMSSWVRGCLRSAGRQRWPVGDTYDYFFCSACHCTQPIDTDMAAAPVVAHMLPPCIC